MNFSSFFAQLLLLLALVQFVLSGDEVIENVNKKEVEDLKGKPLSSLLRLQHNDDNVLHL